MKVKVINEYRDKDTMEICPVGKVIDYPKERAEYLIENGWAKEEKSKPKTEVKKEEK